MKSSMARTSEIREVMDIRQASDYLGISPDTLYKYASEAFIPAFNLYPGRAEGSPSKAKKAGTKCARHAPGCNVEYLLSASPSSQRLLCVLLNSPVCRGMRSQWGDFHSRQGYSELRRRKR
jgi:hypothetical protein